MHGGCVCKKNEFNLSCVVFEVPKAREGESLSQEGTRSQERYFVESYVKKYLL